MARLLSGVTVLDLTRLLPGPYATRILCDLGAEVIKIEDCSAGDPARQLEPVWFEWLSRGKRSIKLDLRGAGGREALFEMVARADALVEGFRPGALARFGFGPEELRQVNPKLVIVSCTGYGQAGSWSQQAGHDLNYLAWSGLLDLMPRDGAVPVNPPIQLADLAGGMFSALSVLMGVLRSRQTGQGSHLDVSMLDALGHLGGVYLASAASRGSLSRQDLPLAGRLACYRSYRAAGGRAVALGALEAKFWSAFCLAIDRPDLVSRQHEADQASLAAELETIFATRTQDEWIELARHKPDICLAPVLSLDEAAGRLGTAPVCPREV